MKENPLTTNSRAPAVAFILALIYFVGVGVAAVDIAIRSYGPWPDEMWGYNVSVDVLRGEAPNSVLTFPFLGYYLPYVSGNYQGAYKSYLHLIYLVATGAAVEYQRYLNLALFAAVGLSMCWAIRPVVGRWLIALPLLIAISDPNYVAFMPSDMGPFLLQNLFSALAFGFLLRAVLDSRPFDIAASLFFASAVAGDKLTGIPVALGLGVTCAAVALWRWKTMLAPRWMATYILAILLPILPNIVYIARAGLSSVTGMLGTPDTQGERIAHAVNELGHTLTGHYSYLVSAIYRVPAEIGIPHYYFAIAVLLVVAVAINIRGRATRAGCALMLLALIFVVTIVAFVLVPGLSRPWHYLIFNPIIYLAMTTTVAWVRDQDHGNAAPRLAMLAALLLLPVNFAVAQYNVIRELVFQANHRGKELSSMAIYPLIDKLKEHKTKNVICLDYGTCISVYLLTVGAIKMDDLAFSADFDKEPLENLLKKDGSVLILRDIAGMQDHNFAVRLHRGTRWFLDEGRHKLPPTDALPLERFDDTQFTLVTLRR